MTNSDAQQEKSNVEFGEMKATVRRLEQDVEKLQELRVWMAAAGLLLGSISISAVAIAAWNWTRINVFEANNPFKNQFRLKSNYQLSDGSALYLTNTGASQTLNGGSWTKVCEKPVIIHTFSTSQKGPTPGEPDTVADQTWTLEAVKPQR